MRCAVEISYILNKLPIFQIYVSRKLNHKQIFDELRDVFLY